VYLSWIEKKKESTENRKIARQRSSGELLTFFPFVSKLYLGGEGYCYYFKWKIRSCKQMPRAFLSTSSLSVSLKKKMTRKANSKDALAPLGLLYDDCSHRLLLLLVFDMVINQKNSNSRRDGMRLKRNILVRSTFLLQLFATLRRERKQQQRRNKCCCCISTLAGAFEFLSLSPHSRPNELRGVLLTARNILLLSVPR
jgi:hypothetical protein